MKKFISMLVVLVIMLTCLPVSVGAAEPPIAFYTANSKWGVYDVSSTRPDLVIIVDGNIMVSAYVLDNFCSDFDYHYSKGTVKFERPGAKGSINVNKKEIIFNGENFTPKVPPLKDDDGGLMLEYSDAALLMGAKAVIRTITLDREYIYLTTKGKKIFKKGTVVRYIDYTPKLSKEYTDNQLTFMQGLSAPLLLHNLYNDSTKIDLKKMEEKMSFLRPYSGYSLAGSNVRGNVKTALKVSWGIEDHDSLIKAVKSLIASGKDPDIPYSAYDYSRAVQLAQWGCEASYLTADEAVKYGMQAASAAQKEYSSWNEFGDDYLRGYASYGGSGGTGGAMYKARKAIVDYIYKDNKFRGVAWK